MSADCVTGVVQVAFYVLIILFMLLFLLQTVEFVRELLVIKIMYLPLPTYHCVPTTVAAVAYDNVGCSIRRC